MKKLFTLFVISITVFGCKNEEDPEVKTIFTMLGNYKDAGTNRRIIIRDSETGEVIDTKPYDTSGKLVFTSEKIITSNKISVTEFFIDTNGTATAAVYNNIDVGSTWELRTFDGEPTTPTDGNKIGSYQISISDLPEFSTYSFSDYFNFFQIQYQPWDNRFLDPVDIYEKSKKYLFTINPESGNPKYKFLENVNNGDNIELSYNDLNDFDKVVKVTLPEDLAHFAYIFGYEPDNPSGSGYATYVNLPPMVRSEVRLGFLNALPNYNLTFGTEDGFEYYSFGPAPESITYVSPANFKVTDKTIQNFKFTTTHAYNFLSATYSYEGTGSERDIFVTYFDSSTNPKFHDAFTPELISEFGISAEKLKLSRYKFVVEGQSYQEFIDYIYDPSFDVTKVHTASVNYNEDN